MNEHTNSTPLLDREEKEVFDDLGVARAVFSKEMEGLQKVYATLDHSFEQVISLLYKLEGRVIVSGMGKSGHVARKIAATLSSTGTPAFFVHPGEASHGDLGMITRQDCIIALSNSGKTKELIDLLEYARRSRIPLVAITQNEDSLLAQASTISLILPPFEEACPNHLAPTTSTTIMMVLGDAIALALLVRQGFSAHDFRRFHPGGELGRKVLQARDLMHTGPMIPLVDTKMKIQEALPLMTEKKFGCLGVVKGKELIGVITDGDLRRHLVLGFFDKTVDDIMTAGGQTLKENDLAVDALACMQEKGITSLFVVNEARIPVGILNIHDCLRSGLI